MAEIARLDDIDPTETQEWLESIDSVLRAHGPERAHFLLDRLIDYTRRSGAYLPFRPNTAYLNTISTVQQAAYPGDRALERRIEAYIRWNAMAMAVSSRSHRSRKRSVLRSSSFWKPHHCSVPSQRWPTSREVGIGLCTRLR